MNELFEISKNAERIEKINPLSLEPSDKVNFEKKWQKSIKRANLFLIDNKYAIATA